MNRKSLVYLILIFVVIFVTSGCETVPKKFKEEVGGIKTRVETLETRVEGVEAKQADVERMTGEQAQALEELKSAKVKTNIGVKPRAGKGKRRTKEIQGCLKSAGLYSGKIDGIKGKNTIEAIREFQRANGLKADGVVGPKTWELLSKYKEGAPVSAAGTEEGISK